MGKLVAIIESKSYQVNEESNKNIIADLEVSVESGQIAGLVGASGIGKTTVLRILASLETFVGVVRCNSKDVRKPSRSVGLVFQDDRLFPWMTVYENLAFAANSKFLKADCNKALSLVDLKDVNDLYPHQLSGGMAKRVAIARSLVVRPDYLLLDEPFSGLDYVAKEKIRHNLRTIAKSENIGIVISSHDIEDIALLSDKILVMGGSPATTIKEIIVGLNEHREVTDREVIKLQREIYTLIKAI